MSEMHAQSEPVARGAVKERLSAASPPTSCSFCSSFERDIARVAEEFQRAESQRDELTRTAGDGAEFQRIDSRCKVLRSEHDAVSREFAQHLSVHTQLTLARQRSASAASSVVLDASAPSEGPASVHSGSQGGSPRSGGASGAVYSGNGNGVYCHGGAQGLGRGPALTRGLKGPYADHLDDEEEDESISRQVSFDFSAGRRSPPTSTTAAAGAAAGVAGSAGSLPSFTQAHPMPHLTPGGMQGVAIGDVTGGSPVRHSTVSLLSPTLGSPLGSPLQPRHLTTMPPLHPQHTTA
jgi:hypothetical protein